jgi:type III secretion protein J
VKGGAAMGGLAKKARLAAAIAAALLVAGCETELYKNLDEREANLMVATLSERGIPASREADKTGKMTVLVDRDRFAEAVKALNDAGLPRERFANMGEVFKRDGLVASPVQERAQMVYALSEELSRTISEIDGVLSARVHVVLPDNDPLKRDFAPSSASVFVRHEPSMKISELLPQIKTLVANGIAGLSYDKVSVTPIAAAPSARSAAAGVGEAAQMKSVFGVWVHAKSAGKLALLVTIPTAIALALAGILGWMLWRKRRPGLDLTPLPTAK